MTTDPIKSQHVFVMEQGLGHVVHTMNLERALQDRPDIAPTVLKARPGESPGVRPLPLTRNWSVQMSWAARRSLERRLAARPVRAIFIHTQVAALMAKRIMTRIPTVVSLDATPIDFDAMGDAYRHSRQAAPLEWMKLRVNRRALTNAAAVVTWSDWAARSVTADYGVPAERVHAIYPGVQLNHFHPRRTPAAEGPLRVLFVGGDFERKGGRDLVDAVASLGGGVELDVVTSSRGLDLPAGDVVRVHRGVGPNSNELRGLYDRADVFALPSRGDCTPLVIAEAMASGLPVVATTVGSIPDMVQTGRNGYLVPPGRPGELASALRALASDPGRRQQMGQASLAMAAAHHDAGKNWNRIFDLLDEVSARGGAGRAA